VLHFVGVIYVKMTILITYFLCIADALFTLLLILVADLYPHPTRMKPLHSISDLNGIHLAMAI